MKNQKLFLPLVFLMLVFLTGCSRGDGKNSDEVDALEDIIATQREKGATVSEDIDNKAQYTWSKDGHLIEIKWGYDMTDNPANPINYKLTGDLSLSSFPQLSRIECRGNKLTNLDMSGCKKIRYLSCEMNRIKSLDLSNMKELENLICYQNPLTQLDVTPCSKLTFLSISTTKLKNIDLSKCNKLTRLDCSFTELENLDLKNNPELSRLECAEAKLSSLDLSQNEKLKDLLCSNNKLKSLKVSSKASIEEFSYNGNPLPLSDVYAIIVPSSNEKKKMSAEKASERMNEFMSYTKEVKKYSENYDKLTLKNGVKISPEYTLSQEGESKFTIDFIHPEDLFNAKYSDVDGDANINSEYMESFSDMMSQLEDVHTIVSYQFFNSKGDYFVQQAKHIEEASGYTDKHYTARAFMDGRENKKEYSQYKGNLNKLNKVFSDHGTIKLTLKYKKGTYTYKLNKYQVKIMRLMLDFCKEGQSYIR